MSSKELYKMEDFYGQKDAEQGSFWKEWIISSKVTFLWGKASVDQANYLTSADQIIPYGWLKITSLGEAIKNCI